MVTVGRLAGACVARGSALAGDLGRRADVRAAGTVLLTVLAVRGAFARHDGLDEPVAVALALAATAPLLLARRVPTLALGLPVLCGAVFIAVARLAWPAAAIAAWLLALALCPLRLPRPRAIAVLAMAETSAIVALLVPARINATPWDATIAEVLAAAIAWWVGESVRVRRRDRAEQARVAHRLQMLAERDAVAQERARIARELHDVVAHHVSTIAVRAATLPYEVDDLPPVARAAIGEIAESARAALGDLRAVLGVLRASAHEAEGAPQPRLGDLPDLIARIQGAGTRVLLTVDGLERTLADGVHVCGYRIVQEALTNAMRHAPGSEVQVELEYSASELTVAVRDDGTGPVPATTRGGGYGLLGMRERVAMLGGSLRAGPRPDRGFEVVATLPCPAPEGTDP